MSNKRIKDLQEGVIGSSTYLPIDSAGGGTRKIGTATFAVQADMTTALAAKAIRDTDGVNGNVCKLDANGNSIDTGYAASNILGLSYTVVSTWT